jgi:16S rRNA (adenine1518-N6/adenine1519-N6)-dimethyltransferase
MRHIPRKRFSQNFLVDSQIVSQIINAINPRDNDRLIEIGPGLGALTRPLIQLVDHLCVVELDRDIINRLHQEYAKDKLTVYSTDVLKFDFSALGANLRVIGNLPYNISTPILFHLSKFTANIHDMHFMLQKEVVDRMVAVPSTHDYGRLSVMLQYLFEMEKMFVVPPTSFQPAPKVESAIVRMFPRKQLNPVAINKQTFANVVSSAFSQRRKTLRNSLSGYLKPIDFAVIDIDPGLRAENLSVSQFVSIANYLDNTREAIPNLSR